MPLVPPEQLNDFIGREAGVSDWLEITQDRIDRFAEVTGDRQFIHVDPERAKLTSFGTTVAHGFLTLSLIPHFGQQGGGLGVEGATVRLNYGLNKVRFLSPVKAGSRLRGRFTFLGFEEKRPGHFLLRHQVSVEIEGENKPALIAETLGMSILELD